VRGSLTSCMDDEAPKGVDVDVPAPNGVDDDGSQAGVDEEISPGAGIGVLPPDVSGVLPPDVSMPRDASRAIPRDLGITDLLSRLRGWKCLFEGYWYSNSFIRVLEMLN
jgi:hypothetical protein